MNRPIPIVKEFGQNKTIGFIDTSGKSAEMIFHDGVPYSDLTNANKKMGLAFDVLEYETAENGEHLITKARLLCVSIG